MTDSNSPDQGPKPPFTPDPNRNPLFDRPPIEPKKFTEPDPNYNPDKIDHSPVADQETLFRAAAIKCAQAGEELADLIRHRTEENFPPGRRGRIQFNNDADGYLKFANWEQNVVGTHKWIQFSNGEANGDMAGKLGIDTSMGLMISLYTDEETRREYEAYSAGEAPTGEVVTSHYYFTKKGEYGKASAIPKGMKLDDSYQPLYPDNPNTTTAYYKTPMNPGDFELAGQALEVLIKRIKNPYWDLEPQGEKPTE